jgi:predicted nucleotidyltransferase/DNA-binding transcriptional ArsR family regulator
MGQGLALSVPIMGVIVPNMGMIDDEPTGLGDVLFSKTQRQVLGLLFGSPDKSYYANEIVRYAGVGSGAVQRELEKLKGAGLLTVSQVGNQKHYQANRHSPIFEELRGIVIKTFGLSDTLRAGLSGLAQRIKAAFIYGSVAKATDTASSDIDLMIVSPDLSYAEVMARLAETESRVGRRINPTLYKPEDFARKRAEDNAFVNRVLEQPKIFLIGTEDDLR